MGVEREQKDLISYEQWAPSSRKGKLLSNSHKTVTILWSREQKQLNCKKSRLLLEKYIASIWNATL